VLTSQPQDNRLRGNQGNAALGVARNISAALRAKLSRSEV
jgi:hypothetical protein